MGLYDATTGARLPVTRDATPDGDADGDAVDLTSITVQAPDVAPPVGALGIDSAHTTQWQGLALLGHNLYRLGFDHAPDTPIHAGDALKLILFWQRQGVETPSGTFALSLQAGRLGVLWEQDISVSGGAYPPEGWGMGEILRDVHQLTLPPDLAPGRYDLILTPAGDPQAGYRLQRLTLVP